MKPVCRKAHNKEMIITCRFRNDLQEMQILNLSVC